LEDQASDAEKDDLGAQTRSRKSKRIPLKDRAVDPFSRKKTPTEELKAEVEFLRFKCKALETPEEARFYNQPSARVRYKYWVQKAWRFDQAAAISCGKDPNIVNGHTMTHYVHIWPFATEFWNRRTTIRAWFEEIGIAYVAPATFVEWAAEYGHPLPQELLDEVALTVRARTKSEPQQSVDSLLAKVKKITGELAHARQQIKELSDELRGERLDNPKARRTYDRLIYALALKFRFKVASRSSAAANIRTLLLQHQIKMDQGVILKRLEESCRAIGDDS
jgi:hypothetical protein